VWSLRCAGTRVSFSRRGACTLDCRVLSLRLLADHLPGCTSCDWLNDLRRDHELLLNEQHARVVIDSTTVICA